jgi:hypothetical protein
MDLQRSFIGQPYRMEAAMSNLEKRARRFADSSAAA